MVDRILEAAARIFAEQGYHGTTTNHVAEAAEVSVGTVYQYFPNKDALLVGLAEQHVAEAIEGLTAVAARLRVAAPDVKQPAGHSWRRLWPSTSRMSFIASCGRHRALRLSRRRCMSWITC